MPPDEIPLEDVEFLKFLGIPKLQREYEESVKQVKQLASKKFDEKTSHDGLFGERTKELQKDKDHQVLINYCIYPFWQKGELRELGYHLIRTEPLHEDGEHDVDFLIASKTKKVAIFGEAKTSTRNADKIVDQGKKRRDLILARQRELNETHIPEIEHFEFVFGVPSIEGRDLAAAILGRKDARFIIWEQGGLDNSNQMLSLFLLPTLHGAELNGLIHGDPELNSKLNRLPTSAKCKLFSPKSHPVTKLQLFAWMDQETEGDETSSREKFTSNDVKSFVASELENYPDYIIEREVEKLLKMAMEIGIVKELGIETYRLAFLYSDPAARYDEIKTKWIEYSIEQDKIEFIKKEKLKLQRKMHEIRSTEFPPIVPFKDEPSG